MEVPSSKSQPKYDEKTFKDFQATVCPGVVDTPSESATAQSAVVPEDDRRPLLQDRLEGTGYQTVLAPTDTKGRFFAVVDGNHRLCAINLERVVNSLHRVDLIRCGIVRLDTIETLLETGTLVNMVRGIQAQDNFQDRCVWVRMHHKIYGEKVVKPQQVQTYTVTFIIELMGSQLLSSFYYFFFSRSSGTGSTPILRKKTCAADQYLVSRASGNGPILKLGRCKASLTTRLLS